jgi:His-Xaa-Ser system radical SAM maturase HxsB
MKPIFLARTEFAPAPGSGYQLLPFRFEALDDERVVLTNLVGEFQVLPRAVLDEFVDKRLDVQTELYRALKARHFLLDDTTSVGSELLTIKARTRAEAIGNFTGLHIFVVSLRCDHSCAYCQVSRQTTDKTAFDMSVAHAERALDMVFASPSPTLKIEFQGGEPLLNFELVKHVVCQAEQRNLAAGRHLQVVIASSLSQLTDEILDFCEQHRIYFSTSLDGPSDVHDRNRKRLGRNSHALAVDGIRRVRERLGHDGVSALMTATPSILARGREIVDEYRRHGFAGVFLRPISPYGFAVRSLLASQYGVQEWMAFYKDTLEYILALNARGEAFREEYSAIVLQKMLSSHPTTYVDLQSPAGMGISAVVYNYDGTVYASDEARMLAEMGDQTFRLGHLDHDDYATIFTHRALLQPLAESVLEGVPQCSECAFLPYCGADPTYHWATQGDFVGHKAFSSFCKRNMAVFKHLIGLLEAGGPSADVLRSWA